MELFFLLLLIFASLFMDASHADTRVMQDSRCLVQMQTSHHTSFPSMINTHINYQLDRIRNHLMDLWACLLGQGVVLLLIDEGSAT